MAVDGSFPLELARTKPYSHSIFNFDVTVCLAQSLTTPSRSFVQADLPDGWRACRAAAWLFPYPRDKNSWPFRHEYLELWRHLNPDPTDREILRNYPVRQPLLWVSQRS